MSRLLNLNARRITLGVLLIFALNIVFFFHVLPAETRLSFLRDKSRHLFCAQALAEARRLHPESLAAFPKRPVASSEVPRARRVAAKSLIEGEKASFAPQTEVSRIIHQSWKNDDPPELLAYFVDTWRLTYPDFDYILWTDEDNRRLVTTLYPDFLEAYISLKSEIYRADFVRNLYMHAFGGIYADLDSESLSSLLPTFQNYSTDGTSPIQAIAFLGGMNAHTEVRHSIPNAFMASSPGHPFWMSTAQKAAEQALQWHKGIIDVYGPEYITGPVALRESYLAYTSPNASSLVMSAPVVVLPPPLIYPYSWDDDDDVAHCTCSAETTFFDTEGCKMMRPGGLVISYWSHSWGGWPLGKQIMEYTPWATPKTPQPNR